MWSYCKSRSVLSLYASVSSCLTRDCQLRRPTNFNFTTTSGNIIRSLMLDFLPSLWLQIMFAVQHKIFGIPRQFSFSAISERIMNPLTKTSKSSKPFSNELFKNPMIEYRGCLSVYEVSSSRKTNYYVKSIALKIWKSWNGFPLRCMLMLMLQQQEIGRWMSIKLNLLRSWNVQIF
jgi:hypothetical protein